MTAPRMLYVLHHRPGPAVPAGASVFDHPGFGDHVAFLQRRAAAGELFAAGPLPESEGDGMTVLEVDSAERATELATTDDLAVVNGVLTVQVEPWHVVMSR
jgi:uncharacterized protein YciI